MEATLKKCKECQEYNAQSKGKYKFIQAYEQGEKVGMDAIGPINGKYIATAIDYFTRKGFAKILKSRHEGQIIKFCKKCTLNNQ